MGQFIKASTLVFLVNGTVIDTYLEKHFKSYYLEILKITTTNFKFHGGHDRTRMSQARLFPYGAKQQACGQLKLSSTRLNLFLSKARNG